MRERRTLVAIGGAVIHRSCTEIVYSARQGDGLMIIAVRPMRMTDQMHPIRTVWRRCLAYCQRAPRTFAWEFDRSAQTLTWRIVLPDV